jgi:ribonuclease Z
MELQFFGTSGAIAAAEDGNVSFVVTAGKAAVMVDLSGNPVQNLLRGEIEPLGIDAVVLTHAHPDHLYALPSLIQSLWLMKRKRPLLLLANSHTAEKAKQLLDLFGLRDKPEGFELIWRIEADIPFALHGRIRATLFPVKHSVPTYGVRVESGGRAVAYSADSAPSPRILQAARGCAALIHEASGTAGRAEELNQAGHSTGSQAGDTADRAGAGTLFLCHFDRLGDSTPEEVRSEAKKHFSGRVVIPEAFRRYSI